MNTLVIHPTDSTTTFLKPIYAGIENATIVNGCEDLQKLRDMVENHDQIIMLGHGAPKGLMARGQFGKRFWAIDDSFVSLLEKKTCVSIWCFAQDFMDQWDLNGFYTGMFISEVSEAAFYGKFSATQAMVDESNDLFAQLVGESIVNGQDALYEHVLEGYGILSETNPVAFYNWQRLFYRPVVETV
jgi:hypothetical protein